jgi:hypothetical protein
MKIKNIIQSCQSIAVELREYITSQKRKQRPYKLEEKKREELKNLGYL